MALQSSDIILVERGGTLYRETYGNRANIESSDLILVDRGGTLYKCTYANWANANSSDLILVERSSTLYKETKANWPTTSNTDIHSANYMVTLGTLLYGQTKNNTNPFSVVEVQAEFSSSGTPSQGTLYIGFRNSASQTYMGDLPIAAVQVLRSNGSTIVETWNFAESAGYGDWVTTDSSQGETGVITNSSTIPSDFQYYGIGTTASSGKRRFSFTDSGVGSNHVGAAQGIPLSVYTNSAASSSVLPVGTANISQSTTSSDGYIFSECSSTSNGNLTWMGMDGLNTLNNGDKIRICYFGGGNGNTSSNGLKTTNSLYLRYVED